jgi:hypothetical protein
MTELWSKNQGNTRLNITIKSTIDWLNIYFGWWWHNLRKYILSQSIVFFIVIFNLGISLIFVIIMYHLELTPKSYEWKFEDFYIALIRANRLKNWGSRVHGFLPIIFTCQIWIVHNSQNENFSDVSWPAQYTVPEQFIDWTILNSRTILTGHKLFWTIKFK